MRPQILTINQNKITWELNGENGISTILYGAYIGKDILMIANYLWEKQGTEHFFATDFYYYNILLHKTIPSRIFSTYFNIYRSGAMLSRNCSSKQRCTK